MARDERVLYLLAAAILILNLFDGALTLAVVESGRATEANPLMQTPLAWGSVPFMAIKTALVSLGVLLLWRLRRARYAVFGLGSLAAVYGVLALYHVRSVAALVRYVA